MKATRLCKFGPLFGVGISTLIYPIPWSGKFSWNRFCNRKWCSNPISPAASNNSLLILLFSVDTVAQRNRRRHECTDTNILHVLFTAGNVVSWQKKRFSELRWIRCGALCMDYAYSIRHGPWWFPWVATTTSHIRRLYKLFGSHKLQTNGGGGGAKCASRYKSRLVHVRFMRSRWKYFAQQKPSTQKWINKVLN